jgi:hypothetical protein
MADFANHPTSITEERAKRSDDAASWTPRDVLVDLLRAIDEGQLSPDALVVCIRDLEVESGEQHTFFSSCSPDPHTTLGILEHIKMAVLAS